MRRHSRKKRAGQLTIGRGAKYLDGFDRVTFAASTEIVSQGTGSLQASGSLTFVTPLLTAASNSAQQITAIGAFNLENASGPDPDPAKLQSFNSGLFITASNVSIGGSIIMPTGVLTAEAKAGDVVLTSGAVIDVSGAAQQFYDQYRYAPGGQVNLTADLGNVTSAPGTTINVSGFLGTGVWRTRSSCRRGCRYDLGDCRCECRAVHEPGAFAWERCAREY